MGVADFCEKCFQLTRHKYLPTIGRTHTTKRIFAIIRHFTLLTNKLSRYGIRRTSQILSG